MKSVVMICALLALGACRGRDGRNGSDGQTVQGPAGGVGPGGPPGLGNTVPFSYEGAATYPANSITQTIPGFSLDKGDIINVYIAGNGQPWTQIGQNTSSVYSVSGDVVTITSALGPQAPNWHWAMNGIKND